MKRWWWVAIGLLLAGRWLVAANPMHDDMLSNAGWSEWIGINGVKGFYENEKWVYSWPSQLPLVSLVYGLDYRIFLGSLEALRQSANNIVKFHLAPGHMRWFFDYLKWFDSALSLEIPFKHGLIVSIKLIPLLADMGIAWLIYKLSKKIIWPVVYLASPFAWYISAAWGQYDQVAYLFLVLAFLSLKKATWASPVFWAISLGLKPTGAILIPLYIWFWWLAKVSWKQMLVGVIVALALTWGSIRVFSDRPMKEFVFETLVARVLLKSEYRVTTNSFNFWRILIGTRGMNQNQMFGVLSAKVWGWLMFGFINLLIVKKVKKFSVEGVVLGMFVVGFGGWLFLTNMLERYAFAGVVSGLVLLIYRPRLLKYWIAISVIFWINLYYHWWYPVQFSWLKEVLEWREGIMTRGLSLINVVIYLIMIKKGLRKTAVGK